MAGDGRNRQGKPMAGMWHAVHHQSSKGGQTPSVCISPPPPSAVQGPELTGQLLQLAGGSGSPRHHLATAQNKDAEDSLLFLPSFLLQFVPSAMLGWWSILAIMELPP